MTSSRFTERSCLKNYSGEVNEKDNPNANLWPHHTSVSKTHTDRQHLPQTDRQTQIHKDLEIQVKSQILNRKIKWLRLEFWQAAYTWDAGLNLKYYQE